MKKFLALMGLVALIGLGMGMTEANPTPEEATWGAIVDGYISKTGACAEITLCGSSTRYNLVNLPGSYSVGDEVVIKGQFVTGSSPCSGPNPVLNVGRIRLDPC